MDTISDLPEGGPCSDEEFDSECDDELKSDDMSTYYKKIFFIVHLQIC
jgi:hypothetical protein